VHIMQSLNQLSRWEEDAVEPVVNHLAGILQVLWVTCLWCVKIGTVSTAITLTHS